MNKEEYLKNSKLLKDFPTVESLMFSKQVDKNTKKKKAIIKYFKKLKQDGRF